MSQSAPKLLAEVERLCEVIRELQQDTLEVVSDWFDSDENEWRRLEQALGLPLTPLSWEGVMRTSGVGDEE